MLTVILVTSAPALSSRGTTKASTSPSMDDVSSRSSWKNYANEDLSRNINIDDDSSFGVATPFLKSFMQVKLLSFNTLSSGMFLVSQTSHLMVSDIDAFRTG